jgi:hypothetical protein
LILVITALELWLRFGRSVRADYRWFLRALAALAIALGFSISDITGAWCEPSNHWIQPHALWHVFSALSLLFSYPFYRQFFVKAE